MTMREKSFAAFILTHGRPNRVITAHALAKAGYTGPVYIVVDDEDKTRDAYIANFGLERVLVFSKAEIAKTFDEGDNFNDRRAIIYARNACFDLAEQVGVRYFIQLDDDYTDFRFKLDSHFRYCDQGMRGCLDGVFDLLLDYFKTIPALSIAMAQGGDFIGGKDCTNWLPAFYPTRKAMNTFICDTRRRFQFFGRINEDVNTYTALGRRGGLFLTVPNVAIQQLQTQSNAGGMTDLYLDSGTYVKSFYTVMYAPSCAFIREMRSINKRLHHEIKWRYAVPKIIDEVHRKKQAA